MAAHIDWGRWEQEEQRLHDADLVAALQYNKVMWNQRPLTSHDITRVVAKYPPEMHEEHVIWVVETHNTRALLLHGWCDYADWEQSNLVVMLEAWSVQDITDLLCGLAQGLQADHE